MGWWFTLEWRDIVRRNHRDRERRKWKKKKENAVNEVDGKTEIILNEKKKEKKRWKQEWKRMEREKKEKKGKSVK